MMRAEKMVSEYRELSAEIFRKSEERISKEYRDNREEILESLKYAVRNLFRRADELQQCGRKEAVAVIGFFYLNSSLLTGSHNYLIGLYDESFYLDQNEVSGSYCPEFIVPHFESDMRLLEAEIRRVYIRVKNSEMERIRFLHIQHYDELMRGVLCDALGEIKALPEYRMLRKSEKPLFLYGGYRDYAVDMEDFYAAFSDRSGDKGPTAGGDQLV